MKLLPVSLLALLALLAGGCGKKTREISDLDRKQAASLVSEAEFAMTLRDYARAEPLFDQATKLCPDNGEYWVNLGVVRRRQGNTKGAREAYQAGVEAFRESHEKNADNIGAMLQEVQVLVMLGEVGDARKALAEARKRLPNNRDLRLFDERNEIERLTKDPGFKEIAL
jgi:hypothetical protein